MFPIEARSEKRVKIVYTQVLPLRANKYRYSYGLRSELLRTKPLRELSLSVTANSALPLKRVTCPTHTTRDQITPHSAQIEFTAQEYTPNRDFEVVFEIDGRQNDVVVIPHQRGDDGYFLVQLTPPAPEGNFQREVIPEGAPLKLILICDTSMSMDESKRREQTDFVAALLASLSPDDQFQVVAADVAPAKASGELQFARKTPSNPQRHFWRIESRWAGQILTRHFRTSFRPRRVMRTSSISGMACCPPASLVPKVTQMHLRL